MASFEIYRLKDEWREQERVRTEAERLKAQMEAREVATTKYIDARRWEHFVGRSEQWREMNQHREFISKMIATVSTSTGSDKYRVLVELKYLESKINEKDPVLNPALMIPEIPDPTEEDLQPFLPKSMNPLFRELY